MSADPYRDPKADRHKTTLSGRSGSDSTQSLGPSCVLPQSFGPSACGNINTGWTKILRSETDASSAAGPVRALTSLPAVYPFEAATHCRIFRFSILSRKTFYCIERFGNQESRTVFLLINIRNWGLVVRTQVRNILQSCHGATAVEFGLIALPFFALSGGCLENGLTYWQQEILQDAVNDASRQIYTGTFQAANFQTTDTATLISRFRNAVCTNPNGKARVTVFNCGDVRVSVMKAATYASATPVSPTTVGANGVSDWNPGFSSYACAGPSDIMVVQAAVDIPVFFTFFASSESRINKDRRVIQSSSVFKVEPYTDKSICP